MQGYTHPREYIVTEWPVASTCSDLWSLVYDHDCSAVVVLCNPSPGVSNVSQHTHTPALIVIMFRRSPTPPSGQRTRSLRSTGRCSRWSTCPTTTTPTSGQQLAVLAHCGVLCVQISLLWMKRAVQCDINLNSAMFHVIYPRPRQLYSIVWVERNPFRTPSQWLCILKSRLYRKFCIFKWCGVYNFVRLGRSIAAKPLLKLSVIGIVVYIDMYNLCLSCLWSCILWMLWIWE